MGKETTYYPKNVLIICQLLKLMIYEEENANNEQNKGTHKVTTEPQRDTTLIKMRNYDI